MVENMLKWVFNVIDVFCGKEKESITMASLVVD